ncbi:MAG: UbiA prenyltransferase family protein [Verrucomicrobiae bacterium]|nr:UbiA prenyltransferase family protein [Verrucomicrobiae bacterium]
MSYQPRRRRDQFPKVSGVVRLVRPTQWTKNAFCFAGGFFHGSLFSAETGSAIATAVAFCFASSAVYAWNDVIDAPRDRLHPLKRRRPVAAGALSERQALSVSGIAGVTAFAVLHLCELSTVIPWLAVYMAANLGYSLGLKLLPVIDVGIIASGFVLRVIAGSVAVNIVPTYWLLGCTYALALLLGFGKRRSEIARLHGQGLGDSRSAIAVGRPTQYSVPMLDGLVIGTAGLSAICFAGYCSTRGDALIYLSMVPMLLGLSRYFRLVQRDNLVETPEMLVFRDPVIGLALAMWAVVFTVSIYHNA